MKKLIYYITLFCSLFYGCSNDLEMSDETKQAQIENLKIRVQALVAEYGAEGFQISDAALAANPTMTDEEIESYIKMCLSVCGTYGLVSEGNGKLSIAEKIDYRTRSDQYKWNPENFSGTFDIVYTGGNAYLSGKLGYSYSQDSISNTYVEPHIWGSNFTFRAYHIKENGRGGEWLDAEVTDATGMLATFFGSMPRMTMDFSFALRADFKGGDIIKRYTVYGLYRLGDESGTITVE